MTGRRTAAGGKVSPIIRAQFGTLPVVAALLAAELVAAFTLGGLAPYAWRALTPADIAYWPEPLDLLDVLFCAAGLACLAWLLWSIFWPGFLRGPRAATSGRIPSTHPSYLLIDFAVICVWWFMRFTLWFGDGERAYEMNLWLLVALIVPVCRVVGWYVLRLRPADGPATATAEALSLAWLQPMMLWLLVMAPLMVFGLPIYGLDRWQAQSTFWAAPVLGAANPWRDGVKSDYVRVQGTQQGDVVRCLDGDGHPSAVVMLDAGRGSGHRLQRR